MEAAQPAGKGFGLPLSDVTLATGIVFILAILFLPIPSVLIDFGLACSLALSVLILMVALWISRPLDFSAFPLVLLIVTMLRLALNIATTRTILSHGHEGVHAAGYVISGFSNFVMGGDFVIGVVVFLVLVIVNFVVITKGATRIAEVGARFTLDAIPGKQMSIDADLSAGIIDEKEAQLRRRELEEESAFFGSMDGASKFVRGEAIAGLIILAINIFGGIIIGCARHGMNIGEAGDVFIKLSVGDGLVSQIPALIVSLAAGLLVSKGGTRGSVDKAVFGQLGAHPRALYLAAALLSFLAVTPGLPSLPFLTLGAALALSGRAMSRQRVSAERGAQKLLIDARREKEKAEENSVKSSLKSVEIELMLGKQLAISLLPEQQELAYRMSKMRKRFAAQYGFVVPEVRVNEDLSIPAKSYRIKIHGTGVASFELRIGEILALIGEGEMPNGIPGEEIKEPAFGMRALSAPSSFEEDFKRLNIQTIDNMGVVLTHLSEVIRNNLPQLLSYKDTRALVDRLEPEYRKLTDEICSAHISYPGLQSVLKLLLAERVSIRNLHLIIEAIAEVAPHMRRSEKIVEHVRLRIAQQLCGDIADNGVLNVLRLGHRWELALHESLKRDNKGEITEFDFNPQLLETFGNEVSIAVRAQIDKGVTFAIITSADARPYARMIIERLHPSLPVLSHAEVAKGMELRIIGSVS
jgi:flagellar biosynthesis protein FlhA